MYTTGSAVVHCCQTGKAHTIKLKDLTTEDGTLKEEHLTSGTALILNYRGSDYPVTFAQLKSE